MSELSSAFKDEFIALIGVSAVFAVIIYEAGRKNVIKMVYRDMHDPWFWGLSFVTLSFAWWGLNQDDENIRFAIHGAMIALISSYFSHLSLIFPAFYIVLVVEYFSRKYIG